MISSISSSGKEKSAIAITGGGKKKHSRKKKKGGLSTTTNTSGDEKGKGAPIVNVKIPTSKTEASSNWKLLLTKKSTDIANRKKEAATKTTTTTSKNLPQFLRRDVKKYKKGLMDKPTTTATTPTTSPTSMKRDVPLNTPTVIPKLTGLNPLGFFDYGHYGHLRTPFSKEDHSFLTLPTPVVAIDCEMVGVGPLKEDALARVSIVNEFGFCLYDKFVKPKVEITDYRTEFSGVREEDMQKAEKFDDVIKAVADLIKDRIVVGHSLKSDFDVLFFKPPKNKIRDTSQFYKKKFKRMKNPALKMLAKDHLKVQIQDGEHNSITDAQAALKLYLIMRDEWESSYADKFNIRLNKYWLSREYRKAFQAIGFTVNLNKK